MHNDMPRWIFASASRHFDAVQTGVEMFVEGQVRDTRTKKLFYELRMSGPDERRSCGTTTYLFTINIMVQTALDAADAHKCIRFVGLIVERFSNMMTIYNNDTGIPIGCASLTKDYKGRDVRIFQLGQIDPTVHIQQTMVAGTYNFTL